MKCKDADQALRQRVGRSQTEGSGSVSFCFKNLESMDAVFYMKKMACKLLSERNLPGCFSKKLTKEDLLCPIF